MPIISQIGSRSWKVRLTYGIIYGLLILGAASMIYPFLLMLSGSLKSEADKNYPTPYPRYFFNDTILFQKYVESKYNVSIDNIQEAWAQRVGSYRDITVPSGMDSEAFQDFLDWRKTWTDETPSWKLGQTGGGQMLPMNARLFRQRMDTRFDGNLDAYRREMEFPAPTWLAVVPPPWPAGRYEPTFDPLREAFYNFAVTRPVEDRVLENLDGKFFRFLVRSYTADFANFWKKHEDLFGEAPTSDQYRAWVEEGKDVPTYQDVFLTARAPKIASIREDWQDYVRTSLPLRFIRINPDQAPAYRYYMGKRDAAKVELMKSTSRNASQALTETLPAVQDATEAMNAYQQAAQNLADVVSAAQKSGASRDLAAPPAFVDLTTGTQQFGATVLKMDSMTGRILDLLQRQEDLAGKIAQGAADLKPKPDNGGDRPAEELRKDQELLNAADEVDKDDEKTNDSIEKVLDELTKLQRTFDAKLQEPMQALKENAAEENSFVPVAETERLAQAVDTLRQRAEEALQQLRRLSERYSRTAEQVAQMNAYFHEVYIDIEQYNKKLGLEGENAYDSFDEIPFPTESPENRFEEVDWAGFIKDRVLCEVEALRVHGPRQEFEEFVINQKAAEQGLDPENPDDAEAIAAIREQVVPLRMPVKQVDWHDSQARSKDMRWEFATRNYKQVLEQIFFHGRAIINTVIFCALAIGSALLINPLAAYALSRYKPPSTYKILLFCMATMAFPPAVTMIPSFLLLKRFPLWPLAGGILSFFVVVWLLSRIWKKSPESLRLILGLGVGIVVGVWAIPVATGKPHVSLLNTFAALVLPGMANGYFIFLLKGFFDSLPRELYEAADLDGAGEFTKFWNITMNLSKPILAVIALNAFKAAYSQFMFALIIIPDPDMWTLMVWIFQLQSEAHQSVVYASLVIAAIPTFLVFVVCQNIIIRGIVVPTEK